MLPQPLLDSADQLMAKAVSFLKDELAKLQIGRANPSLVEDVRVEAYGTVQSIKAVASVSIPDARTVQIQPWDRGLLQAVEKAILIANLGLTPTNDGIVIRINIPPLTEERRKDLAKMVGRYAEDGKIGVRTARQDIVNTLDAMKKDKEMTEDEFHAGVKKVQDRVDHYNSEIESMAKRKELDIMTV